jgi:hypothetical protein
MDARFDRRVKEVTELIVIGTRLMTENKKAIRELRASQKARTANNARGAGAAV